MFKVFFKNVKMVSLLFLVVGLYIIKGRANKKITSPKKVVVAQFAKLGDMVCTTPIFRAVKDKFPNSQLFVIGNEINRLILEDNKDVDKYFVYNKNFFQLLKIIRSEQIDFGCMCAPNFIGLSLLYLAGIPCVVSPVVDGGYSPLNTLYYNIIRKFVINKSHTMGKYAPREYLRLLEPLNIFTDDTTKHLGFSPSAKQSVDQLCGQYGLMPGKDLLVGIVPCAGNKIKQWDVKNFAKLGEYLSHNYKAKIILIGSKADVKEAEDTMRYINYDKVYNFAGKLNLDQLKYFISKISLLIGVDTGPIYIAESFGVATIDIVGPLDENEQPPKGARHKIVALPNRIPALHIMNARNYNFVEARRQIDEIVPEQVFKVIDEVLKS